ncbi:MAG: radical SAM family heme chaperone HemW, partial [Parachlamydiaceae bacterium]|nr:radical SAM family heme chaperone HemW [Parachlamydiaceae bacterium]
LYFHIPFCSKKCSYCHFYVLPDKEPLKLQLMEGFERELALLLEQLKGKRLVSIYFGGGTPALFGAKPLATLLATIYSYIPFDAKNIEITLEANPENITEQLIREYAAAGVNRVSIGVQTLDNDLLIRLGRIHNATKAIDAINMTHQAGIDNISIDLMYDIPGQTLHSWQTTLQSIPQLPITHLSLYNLTIEPHTVFFKYQESLRKELPDAESSAEMYRMAVDQMNACGLLQYEISAFAKNNLYSRHNVGYWTGRPFLGVGPSAFSYWEGRRFRNVANLSRYLKSLQEGNLPIDFDEKLEKEEHQRELLAIALRLLQGVDLCDFQLAHGILSKELIEILKNLEKDEFIVKNGNILTLSTKGILFYDTVAVDII